MLLVLKPSDIICTIGSTPSQDFRFGLNYTTRFPGSPPYGYQIMGLFKTHFIDYAIRVVPFFSPLYSHLTYNPLLPLYPPSESCPWVVHTRSLLLHIVYFCQPPLSILYLPIIPLILCKFSLSLPPLLPHW